MSIATRVNECLQAFKAVLQHVKSLADQDANTVQDDFNDELGRFRVWAGNIGAHRTGQSSLDHRLRDATELKDTVLRYLKDLIEVLERGRSRSPSSSLFLSVLTDLCSDLPRRPSFERWSELCRIRGLRRRQAYGPGPRPRHLSWTYSKRSL